MGAESSVHESSDRKVRELKIKKCSLPSLVAALCALPLVCGAQGAEDIDASTETSYDGLVQVKRTGYRNVWVKPGVDISVYSKIVPGPTQFHYREVRETLRTTTARRSSSATEFTIQEDSRVRLEETMAEIFLEEMSESEYFTLVDEPGRDVLRVWGGLYDIVSNVPPDNVGRSTIYLTRVGQATLVLQIEDSMTGEILARVVDRRAAESAFAQRSSTVTSRAEVRRLARTWARLLRNGLDKWHESAAGGN